LIFLERRYKNHLKGGKSVVEESLRKIGDQKLITEWSKIPHIDPYRLDNILVVIQLSLRTYSKIRIREE